MALRMISPSSSSVYSFPRISSIVSRNEVSVSATHLWSSGLCVGVAPVDGASPRSVHR